MNRRIFLLALAVQFGAIRLQAQKHLVIRLSNGTEVDNLLSAISRLTFQTDYLIVNKSNITYVPYALTTVDKMIISSGTTAVSNVNGEAGLSLYPNPAKSTVYIKRSTDITQAANIYSITGTHVLEIELNSAVETIDISTLRPGVYFLKVASQIIKFSKL